MNDKKIPIITSITLLFSACFLFTDNEKFVHSTELCGLDAGVYSKSFAGKNIHAARNLDSRSMSREIVEWTTGGPYGGPVTTLLVNPENTDILYTTIMSIGLFRSLDGGENWDMLVNHIGYQFHSADLSIPDPSIIYVHRFQEGLYRSDDGGENWAFIPISGCADGVIRPYTHPDDSEVVFAAVSGVSGSNGLYRSVDRGGHWENYSSGMTDTAVTALAFDPNDPLIMYAGTAGGNVCRSADGGGTWIFIGQPDDYIANIAVNPFGGHEPWAAGYEEGNWGYLWKFVAPNWEYVDIGTGSLTSCIVFSRLSAGHLYIGGFTGLISDDGGDSWSSFGKENCLSPVTLIAIDPETPDTMYTGHRGTGLVKTTDNGLSWTDINNGLAGIMPNGLAIHPNDSMQVYATVHGTGIFRTENGGGSWMPVPSENIWPSQPLIDPNDPQRMYIGLDISDDGGLSWRSIRPELPAPYAGSCYITVMRLIATGQSGCLVLGVGFNETDAASHNFIGGGIYTSDDYGETWTYAFSGVLAGAFGTLAVDPDDPHTIYAGTSVQCEGTETGLWKTTDGGTVWNHMGFSGDQISGIAVDPDDSEKIFVCIDCELNVSIDGGQSWEHISTISGGGGSLLVIPTDPLTLYVYSWRGIHYSQDDGYTWTRLEGDLGTSMIGSMAAAWDGEGNVTVYVGTAGGGYSGAQ